MHFFINPVCDHLKTARKREKRLKKNMRHTKVFQIPLTELRAFNNLEAVSDIVLSEFMSSES